MSLYDKEYFQLTRDQQIAWFLFPTNFGGGPVLPYIRCLAKGDSDLETIWLSLYQFLRGNYPQLFHIICNCLSVTLRPSHQYSALATNCYSLPNVAPTGGLRTLQNHIRQCLPKITMNRDFLKVIQMATGNKTTDFIQRLYSSEVIPAKAFSVLYETSAAGLVDEFIKSFHQPSQCLFL